jgi:hypothetical protein
MSINNTPLFVSAVVTNETVLTIYRIIHATEVLFIPSDLADQVSIL